MKKETLQIPLSMAVKALPAIAMAVLFLCACQKSDPPSGVDTETIKTSAPSALELRPLLDGMLVAHRKMIVLFSEESDTPQDLKDANQVGHAIFHENVERTQAAKSIFEAMLKSSSASKFSDTEHLLDFIESDPALYDADRLAFREILIAWRDEIAKDSTLTAVKLQSRMDEDIGALQKIEKNYDKEIGQIFSRFESRSIVIKREMWTDYLAKIKALYTFEQILKEGGIPHRPAQASLQHGDSALSGMRGAPKIVTKPEDGEIFGYSLPPKVIALTFDDGPHAKYTKEVAEILKQYGILATFFVVGSNIGKIGADGKAQVGPGGAIVKFLQAQGHTIGNHTMTHAQLSKLAGASLSKEILQTDALLKAADPERSSLFRFPYGAKSKEASGILGTAGLRSVMWNIDSLDWADPIPSSIADRVMRTIDKEGRGVVLFHDIHERTLKALPLVLNRLVAEGYQFASWDGKAFSLKKTNANASAVPAPLVSANPQAVGSEAWAIIVGVDDYTNPLWPKLKHAVRDAQALKESLIQHFGYQADHVVFLENKQATRAAILSAFQGLESKGLKKSDSLLVFFAGHGSTRTLSSGRELGYIIPVDAGSDVATDAIPMSELQNISESVTAHQALFIMDACYSGLGLTRGGGGGSGNFLRDNDKRIARQMLTAGGSDQMVADNGPNGHSIFTWALLQGLSGKADFNNDNVITATELAAYVAPAVSSVSNQTPAFGSLPGSEGGEFVFRVTATEEYINEKTPQLSSDAIAWNKKIDSALPLNKPIAPAAAVASSPNSAAAGATPALTVVLKSLEGKKETSVAVPTTSTLVMTPKQKAQQLNEHGMQLYKEAKYALALEGFEQALKLFPEYALAANNMGFVHYKQGNFAESITWFQATLKIDPYRAIAYVNLGDAQAKMSDAQGAKASYNKYLELAPSGPSAAYAKQALEKM